MARVFRFASVKVVVDCLKLPSSNFKIFKWRSQFHRPAQIYCFFTANLAALVWSAAACRTSAYLGAIHKARATKGGLDVPKDSDSYLNMLVKMLVEMLVNMLVRTGENHLLLTYADKS